MPHLASGQQQHPNCPPGSTFYKGACIRCPQGTFLDQKTGQCKPPACSGIFTACPDPRDRLGYNCKILSVDDDNCGRCGNQCGPQEICNNGNCGSCPPGLKVGYDNSGIKTCVCQSSDMVKCADGTCRKQDKFNCGACDRVCNAFPTDNCHKGFGKCTSELFCQNTPKNTPNKDTVVSALQAHKGITCNGQCVDTNTDPTNCGGCGITCSQTVGVGATCNNGQCQCPEGKEVFNGQCVDKCPQGQTRDQTTGQCQLEQCPVGQTLCVGQCVDINTSEEHCGACFNDCPIGDTCNGGHCEFPEIPCNDDEDCPPGESCFGGICGAPV